MADFFLGCIATASQDRDTPWYTVIGCPKTGGMATAVSSTGNLVVTSDVPLVAIHYSAIYKLEADIAGLLGCNVTTTNGKARCECSGRFDLSKHPPGPHSDDLFNGNVKEYITDTKYAGQVLTSVNALTDRLSVRWAESKGCWLVKMGNIDTYGSFVSSVGFAFLGFKEVKYMKKDVFRLEPKGE